MYVNVTGPGDYDIPNFLQKDFNEADSQKRTAPCFTLAPKTKQPYWPQYEVVSTMLSLVRKIDKYGHLIVFRISKGTTRRA